MGNSRETVENCNVQLTWGLFTFDRCVFALVRPDVHPTQDKTRQKQTKEKRLARSPIMTGRLSLRKRHSSRLCCRAMFKPNGSSFHHILCTKHGNTASPLRFRRTRHFGRTRTALRRSHRSFRAREQRYGCDDGTAAFTPGRHRETRNPPLCRSRGLTTRKTSTCRGPSRRLLPRVEKHDPALVFYTSGTHGHGASTSSLFSNAARVGGGRPIVVVEARRRLFHVKIVPGAVFRTSESLNRHYRPHKISSTISKQRVRRHLGSFGQKRKQVRVVSIPRAGWDGRARQRRSYAAAASTARERARAGLGRCGAKPRRRTRRRASGFVFSRTLATATTTGTSRMPDGDCYIKGDITVTGWLVGNRTDG